MIATYNTAKYRIIPQIRSVRIMYNFVLFLRLFGKCAICWRNIKRSIKRIFVFYHFFGNNCTIYRYQRI